MLILSFFCYLESRLISTARALMREEVDEVLLDFRLLGVIVFGIRHVESTATDLLLAWMRGVV